MTKSGTPMSFAGENELRNDRRFKIELPVVVSTAMNHQDGWITDVSRKGILLQGVNLPPRAHISINYNGKFVEGTVRWSTPHRGTGIALDRPLQDGPLAQVWQRFNQNIAAFGNRVGPTKPTFGRKA